MHRIVLLSLLLTLCLLPVILTSCPNPVTLKVDGIQFDPIPSGTFTMGAPSTEAGSLDSERPAHAVNIQKKYYLSSKEITQGEWLRIMGPVAPYTMQDTLDENLPMTRVSWFDAKAFAEALQKRNPTYIFRLPTEAEWERAARGGNRSRFYWGDDLDLSHCDSYAWTWRNAASETGGVVQEGAQLIPNTYGLYDISGNVHEWVQDRYHENYTGAPADGSAWGTPEFVEGVDDPLDTIYGVVRGGCCNWNPEDARSASRYGEDPTSRRPYSGFRVLMHQPY